LQIKEKKKKKKKKKKISHVGFETVTAVVMACGV
jgi:hypothetical protein